MQEINQLIESQELISASISSPWNKKGIIKISIRPLEIKGQFMYQVSEYDQQKVKHRNLTPQSCAEMIDKLLPEEFRQAIFTLHSASYHVLVDKKKNIKIIKTKAQPSSKLDLKHNRPKRYLLQEGEPIPFLIELGVMTNEGKVIAKKYDKFRQINRFVEFVDDVLDHLPSGRCIEIVDFGCGKAYLTFALYHYLHHVKKLEVRIIGLDLKQEVIVHCQQLAQKLGWDALHFEVGDIANFQPAGPVDMVIALHACDTATDLALKNAVSWNAPVILCVPCCQHELFSQIKSSALSSLLRHGILKERFAALVTDAARAELLTILGYDVQVLEFIDLEHTPKNLLIRAIKGSPNKELAQERYSLLKDNLQITPALESYKSI